MRLPPASAPRALVTRAKLMFVMFVGGSLRFGWFGRFLKDASNLRVFLSASRNTLPRPMDRLTVPGPTSVPTPALPKRAIGVTEQVNWLEAPGVRPGQTNAARFQKRSAVGLESAGSTPRESGLWVPRVSPPVPEGSPPLIVGVRYGPVCKT